MSEATEFEYPGLEWRSGQPEDYGLDSMRLEKATRETTSPLVAVRSWLTRLRKGAAETVSRDGTAGPAGVHL